MANSQAPFVYDPQLTAVANMLPPGQAYINDLVLPTVTVDRDTFRYLEIPRDEDFTIPETLVSYEGDPNEVDFSATERTGAVEAHALISKVANRVKNLASVSVGGYDPRVRAVEGIRNLMNLRVEKGMADLVFDETNYDPANRITLSGTGKFSNDASDPLRTILLRLDQMYVRPNVAMAGIGVATALRLHPKIISAFYKNQGTEGIVSLEFVASLLGLERFLIGTAWYNVKHHGQDPSMSRMWGNRLALLHSSTTSMATTRGTLALSWGVTFVFPIDGQRMASYSWDDPRPGPNGVEFVKVATQYDHTVIAPDFGLIYIDVVD